MLPAWMISDIKRDRDEDQRASIGIDGYSNHRVVDDCDDDEVLNFGSGGPAPPPPPDYDAQAEAEMKTERERARIAEEQRIAEEARAAKEEEKKRGIFSSSTNAAYNNAKNYGTSRLRALGLDSMDDQFGILPAYYAELDTARSNIPDLDPNPGSYFGSALFENALGAQRNVARQKLTRGYEDVLGPDFESELLADTADDPFIDRIVGEQYEDALTQLQRARDRGQLNDVGYEDAFKGLTQGRTGAAARAQGIGMGVLEKDREQLRNLDAQNRQRIADFDFGDRFDPRQATGRIRSKAAALGGGLEGELRNALGDTQFFDPNALITRGGRAQGMVNPGAALKDAMKDDELSRTSGSSGAF